MILRTIKSKLEQATRLLLINTLTTVNDSVLIVEYPKSGGTWLGQLVSAYLGLPFPRNRMPALGSSVFHGHYLPTGRIPSNKKILFLVRDGRDVMISLYYHQLIWNEKNKLNPKDVIYHRNKTGFENFEDIKYNLRAFIDYAFMSKPSKWQQFTYMGNWAEFNRAWLREMEHGSENIYLVKYEDLLHDTFGTVSKLLKEQLGVSHIEKERLEKVVQKYSFENQSQRKKGDEKKNSFLRKGISGDWKNYFGQEEKECFKKHSGDVLVKLGYEPDMTW
ncbi:MULTISPECIES: sulfotransferase domain-containing protein [Robiginitalea]|uniref:Sulfotransferase domain-containing protein n=1 Tax=Robiginitalea biformata (strain ATCC BAA-864 / DSM 15991 / KCTC 12146 / HTCC2501) TaxID=313596 RepID=A4CI08_ROBBH|nr:MULTISPECIES: sulfotransferase domain-containing protein [Robiginitalea]EAR16566.1 hypothetical protein RB2501_06690 [Robiginitalea biformata HTCC2501]MDC6353198.1 sulfotransferase domain-containing protein [Robiginitalea sp. PM2]MDC6373635.1 sulfotransferase domain-containing protein [Robiginitalea sp. SP8]